MNCINTRPLHLAVHPFKQSLLFVPVLFCAFFFSIQAKAAPEFQAAGTGVGGTGNVSPAWPAHQTGDVALLFIESTGGQAANLSTPAGFVAVPDSPQNTGAGATGTRLTVYWARATSNSMPSPTVTDPGDHVYARILTYRGVISSGDPWDVTGGGVKGTASTSLTVTGVTTTVADTLIVQAASHDRDNTGAHFSGQTNSSLFALTERVDAGTNQGNGGGIAVWDGFIPAAGLVDDTSVTLSNSVVNAFLTIALRPEPLAASANYTMDQFFWDGTANEVIDSSGNARHGTAAGGLTTDVLDPAIVGPPGTCRYGVFDGTNDYINVPNLSNILNGTASLAFWIKTTQAGNNTGWQAPGITGVELAGGADDIFWGWLDASGRIGVSVANTFTTKSTVAINNGAWRHVVLTRDHVAGTYKIYIDGVLDANGAIATGLIGTGFSSIGRIEDTGGSPEYFNGQLDEVRIYNSVLSDSQVLAVMNDARACPPETATATVSTAATGGAAISADTTGTTYTTLTGPVISETDTGGMRTGAYTLTLPAGFEFDTTANSVSIAISTASGTGTDINLGSGAGVTVTVTPSASVITFNVTGLSGGTRLNSLTFSGIRVRPTAGCPLAVSSNIVFGTSTTTTITNNNAGALATVAGTVSRMYTVLPGQTAYGTSTCGTITGVPNDQTAGTPFNITTLIATDQFGNIQTGYSGAQTISYTGPGVANGNNPVYTTAVNFTNGQSTTTLTTTLYKAETTTITATDGTLTGIASTSFNVIAAAPFYMHTVLPGQTFVTGDGVTGTPDDQVFNVPFVLTSLVASDQYYNTATTFSGSHAITYTLSPPAAGSTFTSPVSFTAGISTTSLLSTVTIAGNYTLTTGGGGLTGIVSSMFNVRGSFICSGWLYHKIITIDHTRVGSGGVTDFPVLISITDTDLRDKALANGNDILFTDTTSTTKLAHEIERWDSSTGELVAWVRVPSISSVTDTQIIMYYGNAFAAPQQTPTQVWDANFRLVQHLEESGAVGTTLNDSTSNGNNGTVIGTAGNHPTFLSAGKIDGARNHPGTASAPDPVLEFPHSASLAITGAITAQAWAYIESGQPAPDHNPVFFKGTQIGWGANYLFRIARGPGDTMTWGVTCGGNEGWFEAGAPVYDQWAHYSLTWDGTTLRAYINGVQQTITNNAGGATLCSGQNLNITAAAPVRSGYTPGRSTATEEAFLRGRTDELRIAATARSQAWLVTEYNNQNSPATFYSIGAEQGQNCVFLDHIRIEHDGLGLTCAPETVTVKACTDSTCSSLYTDSAVTTTLIPTGWVGGDTINFTGSTTASLRINVPGGITLGAVSTTPTPSNPARCFNGMTETCSMTFMETGFIFDVPTLTSHKTSAAITITAVRTDQTTQTCAPAFTGTRTVNFWSTYSNPNTGTRQVQINGGDIATGGPGTGVSLNFDSNAQSTFTVRYPDAGQMQLNAQYTGSGVETGLIMNGNDQFVSVPAGLCVESTDADSDCASGDATCSAFVAAGDPFNLTVRAVGWEVDGESNTQFCSGNPDTPNFRLNTIGLTHSLIAPAGQTPGTLGINNVDIVAADNGDHTEANQTISEVGVFTVTATPPAYFGETITTSTSANIGRFIPHHFNITDNSPQFVNACVPGGPLTSFTYMSQAFYFGPAPQLTVTAMHANGVDETRNYGGDFWKLSTTLNDRDYDDQVSPVPSAMFDKTLGPDANIAGNLDYDGTGTLTLPGGNSGDTFWYIRNAAEDEFDADVDVTFSATSLTDPDGVCYDTGSGCAAYTIAGMTGAKLRFGRLVIGSAAGSELLPVTVPLRTEYYDGATFIINEDDSCTELDLAADIELINPETAGGAAQPGDTTMNVSTGISNITIANPVIFTEGRATLVFSPPGADNTGYIDIRSTLDYLLDDLDDNGVYDDDPTGRATFGVFEGPKTLIYIREPW